MYSIHFECLCLFSSLINIVSLPKPYLTLIKKINGMNWAGFVNINIYSTCSTVQYSTGDGVCEALNLV